MTKQKSSIKVDLEKLAQLATELESDEVDIEVSFKKYQAGQELVKGLKQKLADLEAKVEVEIVH